MIKYTYGCKDADERLRRIDRLYRFYGLLLNECGYNETFRVLKRESVESLKRYLDVAALNAGVKDGHPIGYYPDLGKLQIEIAERINNCFRYV